MRLYHNTSAAEAILRDGFRNSTGNPGSAKSTLALQLALARVRKSGIQPHVYGPDRGGLGRIEDLVLGGVWLSDRPLEEQGGVRGDARLVVEIPEELLADFELVEKKKPYREWCVPARIVNDFPVRREREDAPEEGR